MALFWNLNGLVQEPKWSYSGTQMVLFWNLNGLIQEPKWPCSGT